MPVQVDPKIGDHLVHLAEGWGLFFTLAFAAIILLAIAIRNAISRMGESRLPPRRNRFR